MLMPESTRGPTRDLVADHWPHCCLSATALRAPALSSRSSGSACAQLAKQYHPDTSGDSSKATSEQFTKIQSAWETLGDDKARKEYDHKSVDTI